MDAITAPRQWKNDIIDTSIWATKACIASREKIAEPLKPLSSVMREQLHKLRLEYPRLSVKSLLRHFEAQGVFESGS